MTKEALSFNETNFITNKVRYTALGQRAICIVDLTLGFFGNSILLTW